MALQVTWEWPRVPHPILIFDGVEDLVYKDFERDEVHFLFVGLGRVLSGLSVDGARSPILALFGCSRLWLRLFSLTALLRGAVGCVRDCIINLDVFLDPEDDDPHLVHKCL